MENKIVIKTLEKHSRLDKFLVDELKEKHDFSRSYILKLIKSNCVILNGVTVNSQNLSVPEESEIIINIPEVRSSEVKAEKLSFDILYEDDDIVIVNKPNNMVTHPAVGNTSGTLVNGLLDSIKNLSGIGGVERPGIVHRLDKQTTGILIVAKNDQSHKNLSEQISKREVYKEYLALVWGVIEENKGIIEAPIGRHKNDRKKMMVTNSNSKYAKTSFEVIERFDNMTLLRVWIETGRTHQIRVHFNFIKHPIVNDPMYGRLSEKKTDFGQMLHASKVIFKHPTTNEQVEFIAPISSEFNDKILLLRGDLNESKK